MCVGTLATFAPRTGMLCMMDCKQHNWNLAANLLYFSSISDQLTDLLTDPTILFYAGVDYWRRHFWGVLAFTDILSLSSGHTSTPHQVKIVFVGTHSKWVILFQKLLSMCVWVVWLIICVDYWSTQTCGDLPDVFLPVLGSALSSLMGLTTTFLSISR